MKKNYNQPIVEATEVQATALMLGASTDGLPVGDPLSGEGD